MDNAIVEAVLALLAVPGVVSFVAAAVMGLHEATGIPKRVIVYIIALGVTAIIGLTGGIGPIPAWGGEPDVYVAEWLTWAGLAGAAAESLYRTLRGRLLPT